MTQIAEPIDAEIRQAADKQRIDLTRPENAFLLCKKTPQFIQPWLLYGYRESGAALLRGGYLAWLGNTDVFVLDSIHGTVVGFDSEAQTGLVK
jgi:hypothetical protein